MPENKTSTELTNVPQHPAQRCAGAIPVATGLAVLVFAMALSHFVMIGLLGIAISPVAFGALLTGIIRARNPSVSVSRQVAGMILLIAAVAVLAAVVFSSVTLAHSAEAYNIVDGADWLVKLASWPIPAALWWFGHIVGSHWSNTARWISSLAVLFTAPASMILFAILATELPTTA